MNHSDMSLDNYRSQVREFAIRRDGELFLNSGAEYARVVVKSLFDRASTSLDLYTGGLSSDVYDQSLFDNLLTVKGIKPSAIRIVLSEGEGHEKNMELISYLASRGIEIKSFRETGGHIAIADNAMYRFEYDIEKKQAMCAFGTSEKRPAKLEQFIESFTSIWNSATRFPAQA